MDGVRVRLRDAAVADVPAERAGAAREPVLGRGRHPAGRAADGGVHGGHGAHPEHAGGPVGHQRLRVGQQRRRRGPLAGEAVGGVRHCHAGRRAPDGVTGVPGKGVGRGGRRGGGGGRGGAGRLGRDASEGDVPRRRPQRRSSLSAPPEVPRAGFRRFQILGGSLGTEGTEKSLFSGVRRELKKVCPQPLCEDAQCSGVYGALKWARNQARGYRCGQGLAFAVRNRALFLATAVRNRATDFLGPQSA